MWIHQLDFVSIGCMIRMDGISIDAYTSLVSWEFCIDIGGFDLFWFVYKVENRILLLETKKSARFENREKGEKFDPGNPLNSRYGSP